MSIEKSETGFVLVPVKFKEIRYIFTRKIRTTALQPERALSIHFFRIAYSISALLSRFYEAQKFGDCFQ